MKTRIMLISWLLILLSLVVNANSEVKEIYSYETHPDEYCMALNIYHESRGENLAGKYAVADTVLNRVEDNRWPNTVCDVVKQAKYQDGILIKNKCSFSWYCDGKSDTPAISADAWREAQIISYQIMHNDRFRGITEGANHYHAISVSPYWKSSMDYIGQIGDHIFYRW